MKDKAGSLWVITKGAGTTGLAVMAHPVSLYGSRLSWRTDLEYLYKIIRSLPIGTVLLVLEDNVPSALPSYPEHIFVKIQAGIHVGYMNRAYFITDSPWLKRIS